jgi:hypothetical protein
MLPVHGTYINESKTMDELTPQEEVFTAAHHVPII